MSHNCHSALLHCMDFRFCSAITEWMRKNNLVDDCDLVSVAGPVRGLAEDNPVSAQVLLAQIGLSVKLHGIDTVILMSHTDCGACQDLGPFDGSDHEERVHADMLNQAAKKVRSAYADLTVKQVLAIIDSGGTIKFKEI